MIEIPYIMWSKKAAGVALHKLKEGDNLVKITAKDQRGQPYFPHTITINKSEAVKAYGVSTINKGGLRGIWIPLPERKT